MMLTIALVVLVIFLFLRTLWATVIPSLAVPLSLLATFAIMYGLGYSLDNISLMALTISVGFVVDDAIVMIENIVRYMEQGDPPFEAALKGAGQIGFTIISITFSLIAVFIPLFFMGGIIGRLLGVCRHRLGRGDRVGLCFSNLDTGLVLVVLEGAGLAPAGRFNRAAESFFNAALRTYDRGLVFVFRHQFVTLLFTLLLIGLTGYLYVIIPKGFFPQQDTGFIFGQVEGGRFIISGDGKDCPPDCRYCRRDPGVSGVFYFAGAYSYNPTENTARMFIQLKPHDERGRELRSDHSTTRPKVAAVEGAKFFMQSGQDISVGGRLSRTQFQYTLTDTDADELYHWAPIIEQEMRKLHELQDVASDQQIAAPHIGIEIDRDAASRLGLSASLIDETLYDAFGQRQVATMYTSTNQYKVILEVRPNSSRTPRRFRKSTSPRRAVRRSRWAPSRISPRRSSRCQSTIRASFRR